MTLDADDPYVQFKLDILREALPATDAIVFGDMWIVDGGYTEKCIEMGCQRALLIDTLETPRWLDTRQKNPQIDFYKGDFSNHLFMKSFDKTYEIGVVFDILLHQAPLLNTLHLMLEKVSERFLIVQPMLREQSLPNTLIYLPGTTDPERLYPLDQHSTDTLMFVVDQVNHSHWLWGMTRTFLVSALRGEGFELTYEREFADLPNKEWYWWGCIAERRFPLTGHWSTQESLPLYTREWNAEG